MNDFKEWKMNWLLKVGVDEKDIDKWDVIEELVKKDDKLINYKLELTKQNANKS